jgi:transcriptional repressor NrdR
MRCPFCDHVEDKVVDSRESKDGDSIRRRRECLECGRRFTSYERIDEIPYMVVKKDGKREPFERNKVLAGLLRAAEKRPVSTTQLEAICDDVEKSVQDSLDRELGTNEIGKIIMRRLKALDKVAYVRFASVYLEFADVSEFMSELKALVGGARNSSNSVAAAKKKKRGARGGR